MDRLVNLASLLNCCTPFLNREVLEARRRQAFRRRRGVGAEQPRIVSTFETQLYLSDLEARRAEELIDNPPSRVSNRASSRRPSTGSTDDAGEQEYEGEEDESASAEAERGNNTTSFKEPGKHWCFTGDAKATTPRRGFNKRFIELIVSLPLLARERAIPR